MSIIIEKMSKEIRIKKNDVELIIPFTDNDDLNTKLEECDKIFEIVRNKLGSRIFGEQKMRTDLKGICEFQQDHVVLLKSIKSPTRKVGLVLHAYGPMGATLNEISLSTGIRNPSKDALTAGRTKKYFRKIDKEHYGLSSLGLDWIVNEVLPKIKDEEKNASED